MSEIYENKMIVEGELSKVLDLVDAIENINLAIFPDFDFAKVIPYTEDVIPFAEAGDFHSIGEWMSVNWGSYSNAIDPTKEYGGDADGMNVTYHFGTTAPVRKIITALAEKFPTVKITYMWECSTYNESGIFIIEKNKVAKLHEFAEYGTYKVRDDEGFYAVIEKWKAEDNEGL